MYMSKLQGPAYSPMQKLSFVHKVCIKKEQTKTNLQKYFHPSSLNLL